MTPAADEQRDALVERVFGAVLGFNDIYMVHLGDRLGFYRRLAEGGPATAGELASATGTHERYAREWLEQQAVSGVLDVDDASLDAAERRYSLPPGHVEVLTDRDSPHYMAAFARMMVGMARPFPAVIEAFRSGGGVPYAEFDADFCEGQGDMNRIGYVNSLGSDWLPAIPDLHARLQSDPPARVADVACGTGWSSIAIARAYPKATVDGIDLDEASIDLARANAAEAGLTDRVRFEVRDAADPSLERRYDLVIVFEAVHDMSDPVGALRAMKGLLADGGVLIVVDERVGDEFVTPADDVERLMYGWSVMHCLPVGMAAQPSAATGTVMRTATLTEYARAAGLRDVDVLPIEHDFWRFYRLRF